MTLTANRETTDRSTTTTVIDCDIHNSLPSESALTAYLPARWREYHERFGQRGYSGTHYPLANLNAARTDSWPPSGQVPGSDLAFMREQLLDRWGVERGI